MGSVGCLGQIENIKRQSLNSQVSIDDLGKKYESLIDSVIVTNPESQIYIESILPVNHNKASVSLTSNKGKFDDTENSRRT